jgi:hypothetical protein
MIPASDLWMLGLRRLRGEPREANPARSAKYVVAERGGQWRVTYQEAGIGDFGSRDDAVRFACNRARLEAEGGKVTIVVVHAAVQEMHCFTPPMSVCALAAEPSRHS